MVCIQKAMENLGVRYVAHRRLQPLLIAEGAVATFVALEARMLVMFLLTNWGLFLFGINLYYIICFHMSYCSSN